MAIGFIYTGTTRAVPDRALSRTSAPRVIIAKFGDGYEQRLKNGINTIEEGYSLIFNNRTKEFIDDVVVFLDTMGATTAFTFTLPDSNNTTRTGEKDLKVVCSSYTTMYAYDDFYTLTAEMRRVYEP
tara:strand:- start:2806 stop:3186 length:381 start_codon:yes stop_codon:yes gene_type:complete